MCVFLRNALDAAAREGEDPAYLTFLKGSGMKDSLSEVLEGLDKDAGEGKKSPLVRHAVQEVLSRLA